MPRQRDGRGIPLPTVVARLARCSPDEFRQRCPRPVFIALPPEFTLPLERRLTPITPREDRHQIIRGRLRCLMRGVEPPRAIVYPFPPPPAMIGSDPRCDLSIQHPGLSANHARIERGRESWEVADVESAGGTTLEGHRLPVGVSRPLGGGELLVFGGLQSLVLFPGQLYGLVQGIARQRERSRARDAARAPLPAHGIPWSTLVERLGGPHLASFRATHDHPFLVELEPLREGIGKTLPAFDPASARVHGVQPQREGDTIRIGRTPACDVHLTDLPTISNRHAELRQTRKGWGIMDLESSNGTRIDGRRLAPGVLTPVHYGQVIGFSVYRCRFEPPEQLLVMLTANDAASPEPRRAEPPTQAQPVAEHTVIGVAAVQDLLVQQENASRTGTLRLITPEGHGALAFRAGRLVAAECNEASGRAALETLCLSTGGTARWEEGVLPAATPLNLSIWTFLCTELGTAQTLRAGIDAMHRSHAMKRLAG